MNDCFRKNMDKIREHHPHALSELERVSIASDRRYIENIRDLPVFQYEDNGRWKNITSAYDTYREAEIQLEQHEFSGSKYIFVLGEAGLYHLEEALKRATSETTVFLICQDGSRLKLVLESRDLSGILEDARLKVLISSNLSAIHSTLARFVTADTYNVPNFSVVVHPVESNLQQRYISDIQSLIHSVFTTALVNFHTTGFFDHWWSENFTSNLPHLIRSKPVEKMAGSWQNRPVIIVGAGPSLNKNIHLLNRFKGKALIICVDTAYRILVKHGIEPDLIVTVDGNPLNAEHMRDYDYGNIPLLMDVYCHRDIPKLHEGPEMILTSSPTHWDWWTKLHGGSPAMWPFDTGGSVATAAFNFARLIHADPVIMVGEDLSYPGGACYADGAMMEGLTIEDVRASHRMYPVDDISGNPVQTTYVFLYYLRWLEQKAKEGGRTYINATEGGALKEGFQIRTLADCLELCSETQPIRTWVESIQSESISIEHILSILNRYRQSRRQLRAAARYLKLGSMTLERQLQQIDERNDLETERMTRFLERVNARLLRLTLALSFLDAYSFEPLVRDVRSVEAMERDRDLYDESENAIIATRQTLNLFAGMLDRARAAVVMHDEGIEYFTEVFGLKGEVEIHEPVESI